MPVVAQGQPSFASGELSDLVSLRYDLDRYRTGLAECFNMTVMAQGGVTRRLATTFVYECAGDYWASRIVPFQYSTVEAYVIEFGDSKMRIFRDGGIVLDGSVPYERSTVWEAGEVGSIAWTQSADVLYVVHEDRKPRKISRSGHTDWSLGKYEPVDGPFAARNEDETLIISASAVSGTAITLTCGSDLFDDTWIDSLVKLEEWDRTYAAPWIGEQAYGDGNECRYDGNVYRAKGTISSSGPNPPIHTEGVERIYPASASGWEYLHSTFGVVKITAVADNGLTATADVVGKKELPQSVLGTYTVPTFGNATAPGTWRWSRGAWSPARGWPSLVTIHKQRLTFASTPTDPLTTWESVAADYESMESGADDDRAISYLFESGGQVNRLHWMTSGSILALGAAGGEFVYGAASRRGAITPANADADPTTEEGSAPVPAVKVEGSTIFVTADERSIMEFYFDFQIDNFRADALSLLAEHMTEAGVRQLVWHRNPMRTLWARDRDGAVFGCTLRKAQRVVAFHRHDLSGGRVLDMAVIPDNNGRREDLWLKVEREINGETRRYMEIMDVPASWPRVNTLNAFAYLDSKLRYDGDATNTVSGLEHLEGETVGIVADNSLRGTAVVAAGSVTFTGPAATTVIVGLPYTSRIKTLPLRYDAGDGSTAGKLIRVKKAMIDLKDTIGGVVRHPTLPQVDRLVPAGPGTMDTAPSLRAGLFRKEVPATWDTEGQFIVEQDTAAPLTILGVTPVTEVTR